MTHYIFGYGSLMNSASRRLTGKTGHTAPATITGFVRHWGKIETTTTASPLVVDHGDGKVNGLLLAIHEDELSEFDVREHGYVRAQVASHAVTSTLALNASDAVWVYLKHEPIPPCENTPILQTYVDTVLSGCLEISEQFAIQFIENTVGWQHPLVNDRQSPRYINYAGIPDAHRPLIDALLEKHLER